MTNTSPARLIVGGMAVALLACMAQSCAIVKPAAKDDPWRGMKVGVASYSLRKFKVDDAIRMTQELGVEYITLKSFHLAMDSSKQERQEVARKVKQAGLKLMGGGVISMKKEEDVRAAFEYARDAGMPVIVAKPNIELLPLVEKSAIEFDIKVAIHNHGPTDSVYPSPLDAYRAVEGMDKRMGVCIDVGHSVRNGDNIVEVIHAVKDRLHDVHIKDVSKAAKDGKTVELGRGVVDAPGVVKALREIGFDGHVALEFEKDADNPMPGMKESFDYLKKVIAELPAAP